MSLGPLSSSSSALEPDTVFKSLHPQDSVATAGGWALVRYAGHPIGEVVWVGDEGVGLGRASENRLQFLEPEVSRYHARVDCQGEGGALSLLDRGSTNGTFLNGVRIPVGMPFHLGDGDVLSLGGHAFKVRRLDTLELAFHQAVLAQTTVDALTGLSNRITVLGFLEKQTELARRHRRPLSVILCDLDHFKAINDEHGHASGDRVLQGFGRTVQGRIRGSDHAGRIGGEEFVIVLPETTLLEANTVADALRASLAQDRFPVGEGGELLQVTCSLGVAQLGEEDPQGGALLARADRCLYRAKALGRNRVVCELT